MGADSPGLMQAKQLLDELKGRGFEFQRTAPGVDGPLMGRRITDEWVDFVYIEGFSQDCIGWRQRRASLIVAGEGMVECRLVGGALSVLGEVLSWETEQ
ncbi:MAG: hypothetical protein ACRDSP_10250 [Pseudonocardiaceae bacterium]